MAAQRCGGARTAPRVDTPEVGLVMSARPLLAKSHRCPQRHCRTPRLLAAIPCLSQLTGEGELPRGRWEAPTAPLQRRPPLVDDGKRRRQRLPRWLPRPRARRTRCPPWRRSRWRTPCCHQRRRLHCSPLSWGPWGRPSGSCRHRSSRHPLREDWGQLWWHTSDQDCAAGACAALRVMNRRDGARAATSAATARIRARGHWIAGRARCVCGARGGRFSAEPNYEARTGRTELLQRAGGLKALRCLHGGRDRAEDRDGQCAGERHASDETQVCRAAAGQEGIEGARTRRNTAPAKQRSNTERAKHRGLRQERCDRSQSARRGPCGGPLGRPVGPRARPVPRAAVRRPASIGGRELTSRSKTQAERAPSTAAYGR